MKKTMNILIYLLVACLVLALTLNILFIAGVVHGAQGPKGDTGAAGGKGETGATGKSAYEIWLEQGNTGTVEDFLDSLKGTDGTHASNPQWFSGNSLDEAEGAVDGDFFWLVYKDSQFVTGSAIYRMEDGKWMLFADMTTKIPQSELAPSVDGFRINTVEELKAFRDLVNSGSDFKGQTVHLDSDLDLSSEKNWTPIGIGPETASDPNQKPFKGIFDGGEHVISNVTVNHTELHSVGFFAFTTDGAELRNFTLKNVNIVGNHYVAAVVGNAYTTKIIEKVNVEGAVIHGTHWVAGIVGSIYGNVNNCRVSNFEIVCSVENLGSSYDNGDKVGGIVGQLQDSKGYSVTNCTVEEGSLTAYRDLGGIVGGAVQAQPYVVTGNTVKNVTLTIDRSTTYGGGEQDKNVDYFVGRKTTFEGADFTTGNSQEGCKIING